MSMNGFDSTSLRFAVHFIRSIGKSVEENLSSQSNVENLSQPHVTIILVPFVIFIRVVPYGNFIRTQGDLIFCVQQY